MIRRIQQGCRRVPCIEHRNQFSQEPVRIENTVVIGIDNFVAAGAVRSRELGKFRRITILVFKVAALGVQDYEELAVALWGSFQNSAEVVQQRAVEALAEVSESSCLRRLLWNEARPSVHIL